MYFILIPIGIAMPDDLEIRAMSPQFWPKIVVIVSALASMVCIVQNLAQNGKNSNQDCPSDLLPIRVAVRRVVVVLASCFAMYFLLAPLGLVIPSMFLMFFLMYYAGERKLLKLTCIAFAMPTALFLFFNYVAEIPIPMGIFEQLL